tara:strand:- start:5 stop:643 length:639 start_codon:yes stop_codon:yes gene_type:complete
MSSGIRSKPWGHASRSLKQQEVLRNSIIKAAKLLFVENGFGSVSIRNIAREVNISPLIFNQVFENKRALLYHIWDDIFCEVAALISGIREKQANPEDQLRGTIRTIDRYWIEHPDHFKVIFMYQDGPSQDSGSNYVDDMNSMHTISHLHQILEESGKADIFREHDSQAFAESICIQILGVALACVTIPEHSWTKNDTILGILIDGILANLKT